MGHPLELPVRGHAGIRPGCKENRVWGWVPVWRLQERSHFLSNLPLVALMPHCCCLKRKSKGGNSVNHKSFKDHEAFVKQTW